MQVLQLLINGVSRGCIYGLVALGLVLIYKATETINFAQGELMTIGAFTGLAAVKLLGLPFWVAFVFAIAVSAVIGLALEFLLLRPLLGEPAFAVVMVTIALSFALRGLVMSIPGIGIETHVYPTPYAETVFEVGPLRINADRLVVMGVTVALCGALFALFRFTRVGLAMQAVSQNQLAAHYMGIPVERLYGLVWGISAAVATCASILLAPVTFVHVNMGFIGLKALPAAVLGGFSSLPGAIVGGVLIGVIEALAGFYLPEGFKDIAAYVAVLVMLMVKPEGLFGDHRQKKV